MGKLHRILQLILLILIAGCSSAQHTIYFTRHADKETNGTFDPPLTVQGLNRATNLATFLADKHISSVYSTDYQRTLQTALPSAEKENLVVKIYDPGRLEPFALSLKADQVNVLVVGHSNTTPELVRLVGGTAEDIKEDEYGTLYIVTISEHGAKTAIKLIAP